MDQLEDEIVEEVKYIYFNTVSMSLIELIFLFFKPDSGLFS